MAEYTTIKLNPETHLLLDQPLLRLPYELSRNNFKTAQRHIDQTSKHVTETINNASKTLASSPDPQAAALASLDQALGRLNNLKRKLSSLNESSNALTRASGSRLTHLEKLHDIPGLTDVKYEEWSRVRLDRLLVDYLLRQGYTQSARELAVEKGIEDLVDCDEFDAVGKVEKSLREGKKVDIALAWCTENKQNLKKINSGLEFELRLQQFIELVRLEDPVKLVEAVMHARKFLSGNPDTELASQAAGLLAYRPNTDEEPYRSFYSNTRWEYLARTFLETHHTLFSLPQRPLLDIALSAGLSALKTPACHSRFVSPSSGLNSATSPRADPEDVNEDLAMSIDSIANLDGAETGAALATSVCPICSTELNRLAKNVPYAHHSKSHVESDPVVLPNGRIYGRERLLRLNEKMGTPEGFVKDPVEPTKRFELQEIRKVFIS